METELPEDYRITWSDDESIFQRGATVYLEKRVLKTRFMRKSRYEWNIVRSTPVACSPYTLGFEKAYERAVERLKAWLAA